LSTHPRRQGYAALGRSSRRSLTTTRSLHRLQRRFRGSVCLWIGMLNVTTQHRTRFCSAGLALKHRSSRVLRAFEDRSTARGASLLSRRRQSPAIALCRARDASCKAPPWPLVLSSSLRTRHVALHIRMAFEMAGASVVTVYSLTDAIRHGRAECLSGAVLDYRLRSQDGDASCRHLRQRNVPFILHSGTDTPAMPVMAESSSRSQTNPDVLIQAWLQALC
jgi:CheY-like chemotaxis protein